MAAARARRLPFSLCACRAVPPNPRLRSARWPAGATSSRVGRRARGRTGVGPRSPQHGQHQGQEELTWRVAGRRGPVTAARFSRNLGPTVGPPNLRGTGRITLSLGALWALDCKAKGHRPCSDRVASWGGFQTPAGKRGGLPKQPCSALRVHGPLPWGPGSLVCDMGLLGAPSPTS